MQRQIACAVWVVAAGAEAQAQLRKAKVGDAVQVTGFINRMRSTQGQSYLTVHALELEWF